MKKVNKISIFFLALGLTFGFTGLTKAATAVDLGTADNFAILAGSGITNSVGPTTVNGDVGSSPTATEAGFGSVTLTGTDHLNDGTTTSAKTDLDTAYTTASGEASTATVTSDLGTFMGGTLSPGVYTSGSSIGLTGTVTLDGGGDPNATFIFQAGSTLTTASNSHVNLINSAQACNVFWQVGSSATLGTGSDFKGNILAFSSITDSGGSTVLGRFLARGAAVTLNNTSLTKASCAPPPTTHLIVIKHVSNTHTGTSIASDFTTTISGVTTATPTASGAESPGVDNILTSVGAYSVDEGAHVGYDKTLSTDCSGTIILGDTKTCTITNDDVVPPPPPPPLQGTIHIVKHVVNDNGGSAIASDFTMNVSGTSVSQSSFSGSEIGVDVLLDAGSYAITETGPTADYSESDSIDCSGTILAGGSKTCTITNDDIALPPPPPTTHLIVIKHVSNTHTGTSIASDFTTTISGVTTATPTASGAESPGVDNILTSVGAYSVDEGAHVGYDKTLSTDCSGTIILGDTKTCTITNDDVVPPPPPPTPAVSNGGGPLVTTPLIGIFITPVQTTSPTDLRSITYNYMVWDIGTQQVLAGIKATDDKCSPIVFLSGDTNGNGKLDPGESWKYSCTATVLVTTTNNATVSGYSDDAYHLSASATASSTVMIGVPGFPEAGSLQPVVPVQLISDQSITTVLSTPTFYRSLSFGLRGADVTELQIILEQKGFLTIPIGVPTGYFGPLTRAAVAKYQTSVGLPSVGIFGPLTRASFINVQSQ